MISRLKSFQAKAGLTMLSLGQLLMAVAGAALVFLIILFQLTSSLPITVSCFLCVCLQMLDSLRSRVRKLAWQQNLDWPKYLDAIYSSAWAGTSLQQAILDCRGFAPRGSSWAIVELERDLISGLPFEAALVNLKNRLGNSIADRFVEVTRLAHLSGGKGYLSALRSQALQLRLENATWQEIEVKQNWVIASAKMAVYAPWLVLLLLNMRPETAQVFTSSTGMFILTVGLISTVGAFQLIRFLGSMPERQRVLGVSK